MGRFCNADGSCFAACEPAVFVSVVAPVVAKGTVTGTESQSRTFGMAHHPLTMLNEATCNLQDVPMLAHIVFR